MAETKSKAKSDEAVEEATVAELQERAAELNIDGRSKMNKDELQAAIAITEAAPADAETPRYPRERLLDEAEGFAGVSRATVAGALATIGGDGDLTRDELKAAVERFLNTPQKEN